MNVPKDLTIDGGICFLLKDGESVEDCRKRIRAEYLDIYGELPDRSRDYLAELLANQYKQ